MDNMLAIANCTEHFRSEWKKNDKLSFGISRKFDYRTLMLVFSYLSLIHLFTRLYELKVQGFQSVLRALERFSVHAKKRLCEVVICLTTEPFSLFLVSEMWELICVLLLGQISRISCHNCTWVVVWKDFCKWTLVTYCSMISVSITVMLNWKIVD